MITTGEHALKAGFSLGGWMPRCLQASPTSLPRREDYSEDEFFMSEALLAAMEGVGRPNPNPCVGAVLVKNGRILARAATLAYGDLHAERVLLQKLSPEEAQGATVYVTLEPCAGTGKQPPCTDALLAAKIARCVVGAEDPHPKAAGQGLARLKAAGVELTVGCLQEECRAWHFPFLSFMTGDRPVLIGKWAQTLDGHLADDTGTSQWISGPYSRIYTHWLRQKYDAILVGIGTALADRPSLTVRDAPPPHHRHPHKIIFDPQGRLKDAAEPILEALGRNLADDGAQLFWMVDSHIGLELGRGALAKLPHHTVLLRNPADWEDNMQSLEVSFNRTLGFPLQSVLVEGGPTILTQLLRADMLDALHVFVRAKILGGSRFRIGRMPEEDEKGFQNPFFGLNDCPNYRLLSSHVLGDDVLLECVSNRWFEES